MKRKNVILVPLFLTLSHLGEGTSGNPTASGWGLKKIINLIRMRFFGETL
jgi:hypothetical protein